MTEAAKMSLRSPATICAALAGAPLAFWPPLRTVMIAGIATLLGGAFTPDIADRLALWPGGAVLVVGFVGLDYDPNAASA